MKKFTALLLAVAMVSSLGGCSSAGGTQSSTAAPSTSGTTSSTVSEPVKAQYVIKLAHGMMEDTPQHQGSLVFKKLVEEKTGGQVSVELFPAGQLGSDIEIAEMLQAGTIQAGIVPTAKLSGFHAPLQVIDLPFIFPSKDAAYKVLDNTEFKSMLFDPMEKIGLKGLSFWESGFKQFTANKELKKPNDFKGLKFRVMESPLLIAQFKALGANPVSIDFSETYNSLQQKACDGQENPLNSIVKMKFYEVQSNMTVSNHGYLAYALMMSKGFWDGIPADLQAKIQEAANEAAIEERAINAKGEIEYVKTIKDSGTVVTELTTDEVAVFAEAMKPVHKQFEEAIGADVLKKTYELVDTASK